MSAAEDVQAVALLVDAFDAAVQQGTMAMHAAELAAQGFAVFPLAGKVPMFRNPHPKGSPERKDCRGECGLDGHGFWDGTTSLATVARWWSEHPKANIGVHVPAGVVVVDVDPRHRGDATISALADHYGPLPATLTTWTGSGGHHLWFLHEGDLDPEPLNVWAKEHGGGCLSDQGEKWISGIDLKVHDKGYVVAPPSIHPESRRAYHWVDAGVAPAPLPGWLADLLTPAPPATPEPRPARPRPVAIEGVHSLWLPTIEGPADRFGARHTWAQVLTGWSVVAGDGESDGSSWRHPSATAESSATISHGLLFVYSTSTAFEPTTPSCPHGYTKFRAWATLEHRGDLSAAARAWIETERGAA